MNLSRRAFVVAAVIAVACGAEVVAEVVVPLQGVATAADNRVKNDEKQKQKKAVDAADVYFGDATKWEKPAEVDPDKVYAKIDEYKEILDNGLKPGDAKYEILMCKASKRFTKAVRKTAKDGGYDLVARNGSVKGVDKPPDVTSDAIANL